MNDVWIIALVGVAHFVSHFGQLALPPLFPVLRGELGVTYAALGFAMSLFYGASGVGQAVSGFLVDRHGARRIMLGGMALLSGAICAAGLVTTYAMLLPIAVIAGLGNSVFHPADYAILTAVVDRRRLGRAYSVHGVCGTLGYASAPVVVVAASSVLGWRAALVIAGAVALGATAIMVRQTRRIEDDRHAAVARGAAADGVRGHVTLLLAAPIVAAFAYFALVAMASIGLQTFSVAALMSLYGAPIAVATATLTALFVGTAGGSLVGGVLADRTGRHDRVAVTAMAAAAGFMLLVASGAPSRAVLLVVMALVGASIGVAQPSRDLLVRGATPPGASGRVFGFVYSGLDLGASVAPLVLGWLLDRGEPRTLFVCVAGVLLLTTLTIVQVRRRSPIAEPPLSPDARRAPAASAVRAPRG